jgi:hypothetical protein
MSVEIDHMISESMASDLGGRRFGGGTALCAWRECRRDVHGK